MAKQLKIVIDTNVLIQMLGRFSKYHFLWKKFIAGEYILCISNEILHEYEEILNQHTSPIVLNFFMKIIEFSDNIIQKDPFFKMNLIKKDPDDNKFVDGAFASQADFIVTNDNHFAELKQIEFPKIEIKTIDEFAELLASK